MILRIKVTHPSTFEELATGVVDGGLHITRWFAPSGLHEGGRRRPSDPALAPEGEELADEMAGEDRTRSALPEVAWRRPR